MTAFIDENIEKYAYEHTKEENDLLKNLRAETYEKMYLAHMQIGRVEGQLLKMLARLINTRRILEIGMFTGYSALMMAEALPEDGELITCDINTIVEEMATRYFAQSPHGHKIKIRMAPALQTIETLKEPFDMIFIDADKSNYPLYYEACLNLLRPGGLIAVDNVLWDGEVLNPEKGDADTKAIDKLNKLATQDDRVENVCLTVRDGLMLIWKKPT